MQRATFTVRQALTLTAAAAALLFTACGERSAIAGPEKAEGEKAGTQSPSAPTPAPAMTEAELKKKLTPLQYQVAVQCGTEPAFQNEFWNNKKPGIYVDIISGRPLFSSTTKFDSGTGWPSFWEPIDKGEVVEVEDRAHGMVRTEVRSKSGDAHLGHVFQDGPAPTGMRYCINSASLRFIPVEDLEKEGYGQYRKLFEKKQTE